MRPTPVPRPNSAVPMGRPIAITEPNAISRMIAAARRPSASLSGISKFANISPPYSMVRPSSSCGSPSRSISVAEIDRGLVIAVADLQLGERDLLVVGDLTSVSCRVRTRHVDACQLVDLGKKRLHLVAHAGFVTPWSAWNTI